MSSSRPTSTARSCCSRPRAQAPHLRRFVQISTDEVYGSVPDGSSRETDELRPRNPVFGEQGGRRSARLQLLGDLQRAGDHHARVEQLRSEPVPREGHPALHHEPAIDDIPVPLYGDGLNERDWLHVADHCRGVDLLIDRGIAGRGLQHRRRQPGQQRRPDAPDPRLRGQARRRSSGRSPTVRVTIGDTRSTRRSCGRSGGRRRCRSSSGLRETVAWYRQNEWWWRPIKDADPAFRAYYDALYGERRA